VRLRIVNFAGRSRSLDPAAFVQDALDRRGRRHSAPHVRPPQFDLDGLRTDQPNRASLKALASLDHQTTRSGIVPVPDSVGAAGRTVKSLPPQFVKARLPLRQPRATAAETLQNRQRLQAFQQPTNCFAAKMVFFFLVHAASFSGSMDQWFTML